MAVSRWCYAGFQDVFRAVVLLASCAVLSSRYVQFSVCVFAVVCLFDVGCCICVICTSAGASCAVLRLSLCGWRLVFLHVAIVSCAGFSLRPVWFVSRAWSNRVCVCSF